MKSAVAFALFAMLALAACHHDTPPPPKAAEQPPQKTVLDDQMKAMQKAKDVQKIMDNRTKQTDKQLDDQGG